MALFDGLSDACLMVEAGGRLRYANESARELLKLHGRMIGRKLSGVLADRHALDLFRDAVASGKPRTKTLPLTLSSDGARAYEVSARPMHWPGEEMLVRVALRHCETPAVRRDPPPPETSDLEAFQQLGDPLTIIQGYLENLLDGVIRDPVVMRQCLSAMQRQAAQIQRILGNLRK